MLPNPSQILPLILLFPSLCLAWSGDAHQLVGLIAHDHLTPQARTAAKELLDGAEISGFAAQEIDEDLQTVLAALATL